MGALSGTRSMPKKSRKTAPRATSSVDPRRPKPAAAKRPAAVAKPGAEERIARALEAIVSHLSAASPSGAADSLGGADAFVWHPNGRLAPVPRVSRVDLGLLKGIDRVRDILIENTQRFTDGLPANNVLLWGARGSGKSSLVKAAHAAINVGRTEPMVLVEIHREDIPTLPRLLALLRTTARRCLLFCDDLSFDAEDTSYKSLKALLDGGIEGRPDNVILYATSNRRHLLSRDMIENERSTAIHPGETVEEKVSLSDRFGLWLGFHNVDQPTFHEIVQGYARRYSLDIPEEQLKREANEWSITRGSRSGRVAWQYIQDLAGRLGKRLD